MTIERRRPGNRMCRITPVVLTLLLCAPPCLVSAGALNSAVALPASIGAIQNSTEIHTPIAQTAAGFGRCNSINEVPPTTSPPPPASCAPNGAIVSNNPMARVYQASDKSDANGARSGPGRYASSSVAPQRTLAVPVFDALGYPGKPDTIALGLRKIHFVDRNPDQTTPPNEASVRQQVAEISKTDPAPVIVFDIESPEYPVDIRQSPTAAVDKTLVYLGQLIYWARSANSNAKIGFYGILPIQDYWSSNLYNSALHRQNEPWWRASFANYQKKYTEWQNANAYIAPLAQKVDYVFPSLYTFYDSYESDLIGNSHGWKEYALLNIAEARKYNKPIYPFIWPQFHPGGTHKDYRHLPPDYWKKEITLLRNHADGMVLWGAGLLHETWNDDAPWWQATLERVQWLAGQKLTPLSPAEPTCCR